MSKQRIEKNVQIITIDKTEAFKYKTTFFAGKDAKTGHKNASNTADKHPHTPAKASRRPGSARGLCGGVGMFICCVGCVFMPCFCIFSGEKGRFIFKRLRFVDGYYLNILLDSLLTH